MLFLSNNFNAYITIFIKPSHIINTASHMSEKAR